MNMNDVLKLVNAGFSKADILALAAGQVQTITAQEPTQAQTQEPEPGPEPEPAAEPNPEPVPQNPETATLSADIAVIKQQLSALQKSNIISASQPAGANKKETVVDVWKNFFEGDEK